MRDSGEPATPSDTDLAICALSREQPSLRSPSGSADQAQIRQPVEGQAGAKRNPTSLLDAVWDTDGRRRKKVDSEMETTQGAASQAFVC